MTIKSCLFIIYIHYIYNMLDYNKIGRLIEDKNITKTFIAKKLGMTREGFSRSLKDHNFKISTLEIVSEILEVSPAYFFKTEYPTNDRTSTITESNLIKIKNMTNLIESQKDVISLLKEKVSYLEKRLSEYEDNGKSKQAV